jgi:hypothetical protein
VGISRDYPLKTRPSKQPIGEILEYAIIPSNPLIYPKSKQGLEVVGNLAPDIAYLVGRNPLCVVRELAVSCRSSLSYRMSGHLTLQFTSL